MTAIAINGLLEAEYFDLESNVVGDAFRIFVAKPPFVPRDRVCPTIYAADGNAAFPLVTSIQRALAWGSEAPAAYVFGIGYPTERGYLEAAAKRNRDYAPTEGGEYARAILGVNAAAGAAAFLRFIREELKPALQERYAIDPSDATFFGSSLGGLFGAWTLLTEPTTFRRYVLASPAISWNDEEVWRWEEAYAARNTDLCATVFLSAGSLEAPKPARENALQIAANNPLLRPRIEAMIAWMDAHGWPRTSELATEFAAKLRSRRYASLDVRAQVLPEETHLSVPPAIVSRGLRYVFGHWRAPAEA